MAARKFNSPHHSAFMPSLGIRLFLLMILSIGLQYLDNRDNYLDPVRQSIGATIYPAQVVVDAPVSAWRWMGETTSSRKELQTENNRLKSASLLTQARLQRFAILEAENNRLRAMLDARTRVGQQVRVAEVLSVNSNPFRHVIVIDKGKNDGVYDGQALADAEGIIGQILETGIASSQCLLISDPRHDLPVEVNRNGLRTIARGTGDFDTLNLPFITNNADIQPGDLLVTSGMGGIFPEGYPVATVNTVQRLPQQPFANVTATPKANLNQVREIMLILTSPDNTTNLITIETSNKER
ncbi:MAG: rod shape-determining protein MreC [Woeseia sp.]|nr:rod shape-determining protein MreC [Woeseia sp.]